MEANRHLIKSELLAIIKAAYPGLETSSQVTPSLDGFTIVLVGTVSGTSVPVAQRRRRAFTRLIAKCGEKYDTPCVIVFNIDDALLRFDRHIQAVIAIAAPNKLAIDSIHIVRPNKAHVYLSAQQRIPAGLLSDLKRAIAHALPLMKLQAGSIEINDRPSRNPPDAMILNTVRVIQPCTIQAIASHLSKGMYSTIDRDWLENQVDRMRQHGLLVGRTDGYINLTGLTVAKLSGRKGRDQADIRRALHLARRTW